MGIKINVGWQWSGWYRNTYNLHKNWSEPMQIVWKLIGDRLGGIYRSMKKSSTILPGQASATVSRTKLDRWCQTAADLTPWPSSAIRPRHWKLDMSKKMKPQQKQQQQPQKQAIDLSSKGGKWGYWRFISEPANTTGGRPCQSESNKRGKSGGNRHALGFLLALWASMEVFEGWLSTGKCLQGRSLNHMASIYPKFSQGGNPPQQQDQTLAPCRDGGHEVK